MSSNTADITYVAHPTIQRFHDSTARVKAIVGPFGSGKSVGCVMELFMAIIAQEPHTDGIRYSKVLIARKSYRMLMDTTIPTFFEFIPKQCGTWYEAKTEFRMDCNLNDGTRVKCDFLFRSLELGKDIDKLKSLNLTFVWLHEVTDMSKQVFDVALGRVNRYPPRVQGGATRYGVIMDANPCDKHHWFYKKFEVDKPRGYEVFHQPSGLSPEAENLDYIGANYYQDMAEGSDPAYVNVFVHGEYGHIAQGEPCFPSFYEQLHTKDNVPINPDHPVLIGVDFGLTPAAVFGQLIDGKLMFQRELVTTNTPATEFVELVMGVATQFYPGCSPLAYGDPAGNQRAQTDASTVFDVFRDAGLFMHSASTNVITARLDAVSKYLTKLQDGEPAFIASTDCPNLIAALAGGYCYDIDLSVDGPVNKLPRKDRHSHVADALQYVCLEAANAVATTYDWNNYVPPVDRTV